MHRRNVDLPEPEGPMRQNTSPVCTSRSMPLRTSTGPNDLWTPSAFTMAVMPTTPFGRRTGSTAVLKRCNGVGGRVRLEPCA